MTFRSSSNTAAIQVVQGQVTTLQGQASIMQTQINGMLNPNGGFPYVVATPSSGSTYNAVTGFNLIESGGLLATLTISLPAGSVDGQLLALYFLNGITLASWAGAARNSSPVAIAASSDIYFLWVASGSTWHRCN